VSSTNISCGSREPVQVGLVVGLDPVDPRIEAFAVSADHW
jgi:hypothetical protein